MKRFALTFTLLCAASGFAYAGGERYSGKDKEVTQQAPEPCEWYRAHEWNLSVWGTYAFSGNTGDRDKIDDVLIPGFLFRDFDTRNDTFLDRDSTWGGGVDVKYFFNRYLGMGAEGFVVAARKNIGGAGLVTFTARYPIGCSRFAPYGFAGVGAAGGGSQSQVKDGSVFGDDFHFQEIRNNTRAEAIGQFGAGMEVRLNRPSTNSKIAVSVITDFAWNLLSGADNNFGMARVGLNFSY
jgi:hypothetical protein